MTRGARRATAALGAYPRASGFRNVPRWSSSNACRSCSCVFITMGPYHATGRLSASAGGAGSAQPTGSVGTARGPEALPNVPAPPNTYANACRVVSGSTG